MKCERDCKPESRERRDSQSVSQSGAVPQHEKTQHNLSPLAISHQPPTTVKLYQHLNMADSRSLASILNSNGTGLSPSKSVRSNDRVFKYESEGAEAGDGIDRQTEQVLRSIERVEDQYRHDTVRDINWGMTILANSIKVVSAVLTILSVDQTDR